MKKILFLLLCTVSMYGQVSTGQEQEFDYGIKNNSTQTVTTPTYLGTVGADGTYGKILPSSLPISTAVANALDLKVENSSGAIQGFAITNNGDGTVNIATGTAYLRTTNDPYAPLIRYVIPAVTNLALTDNANNFVLVDYNGGSPALTVSISAGTVNTTTNSIAYVISRVGTTLDYISLVGQNVDANAKLRRRFLNSEGLRRANGAVLTASNRNLILTSGLYYSGLIEVPTPAFNTSTGSTFTYAYENTGVWTRTTGNTQINNTQYSLNGVLTSIPTNDYRVDYTYILADNPSKLYVLMGTTTYANISLARLAPVPTNLPSELQVLGTRVGRTIIQKDATTTETTSEFATIYQAGTATLHNDLGGLNMGDFQHLTVAEKANLLPLPEKGIIIDETTPDLSNYLVTGSWSVSGANINVPDGGNNFSNNIQNTTYGGTKLSRWTMTSNYIIPTISATSYGITLGTNSISSPATFFSIGVRFCADTAKKGYMEVYLNNSTAIIYKTSFSPLIISTGDITEISVKRINNSVIAVWKNITTGKTQILEYEVPTYLNYTSPNFSRFAIYANGGATTINSLKVVNNMAVGSKIIALTDSMALLRTINFGQTWVEKLNNKIYGNVQAMSGGGDRIEDNNPLEISSMLPKYIIVQNLSNNVATGDTPSQMMTKLDSFLVAMGAHGYSVANGKILITSIAQRNDVDVTAHNVALRLSYPDLIDASFANALTGTGVLSVYNDGIHFTEIGHTAFSNVVFNYLKSKSIITETINSTPLKRDIYLLDIDGKDRLVLGKSLSLTPKSMITLADSGLASSLHLTGNGSDGLSIGKVGGNSFHILGGVERRDDGLYYATNTSFNGIVTASSYTAFYGYNGVTIGQALTLTSPASTYGGFCWGYADTAVNKGQFYTNFTQKVINLSSNPGNIALTIKQGLYVLPVLTGNVTIQNFASNPVAGETISLRNNNTSAFTVTVTASNVVYPDGTSFTLVPNKSAYNFKYDGTNWVSNINNPNLKANIESPAFTGSPTAPTPTLGDNDTSIATTAFVLANSMALTGSQSFTGTKTFTNTNATVGQLIINNSRTTPNDGVDYGLIVNNSGTRGINIESSAGIGIRSFSGGATGSAINTTKSSGSTALAMQSLNAGDTGDFISVNPFGSIDAFRVRNNATLKLPEFTVATLPTITAGQTAYATVTDALAPTYMATVVGGGAVVTPVFYNGTNWVAH
jgi:hypothetical protein